MHPVLASWSGSHSLVIPDSGYTHLFCTHCMYCTSRVALGWKEQKNFFKATTVPGVGAHTYNPSSRGLVQGHCHISEGSMVDMPSETLPQGSIIQYANPLWVIRPILSCDPLLWVSSVLPGSWLCPCYCPPAPV